VILINFSNNAL